MDSLILAAVYNTPLAHGGDLLEAGVMVSAMAMPIVGIVIAVVIGGRALAAKEAQEAAESPEANETVVHDASGAIGKTPNADD